MPKPNIALFFESVYNDRPLQGALHAALCNVAPEVVVEIAAKRGFDFSVQDLQQTLADSAEPARISEKALATRFWAKICEGLGLIELMKSGEISEAELSQVAGGIMKPENVTYSRVFSMSAGAPAGPLPSTQFVRVQGSEYHDGIPSETTPSAVDLYEELS
jgi:predicted ribosomally synthesized peptide with nif11-like leader